jgi:type 2A phosphatase activator TIP41
MKDCFFGLIRLYVRVDDVVVRIYDTRFYYEFGKDFILREFTVYFFN